jgi:hypothetical protein
MEWDEKDIRKYTATEDCEVKLTSGSAYYGRSTHLCIGEWQKLKKGDSVVHQNPFSIRIKTGS